MQETMTCAPVALARVWLMRAEGPSAECVAVTVTSWFDADLQLKRWARTAPDRGGYDKVDFRVTWQDGEDYAGRYDMTRTGESGDRETGHELARHIASWLAFVAHKPACLYWGKESGEADDARQASEFARLYLPSVFGLSRSWWCCEKRG